MFIASDFIKPSFRRPKVRLWEKALEIHGRHNETSIFKKIKIKKLRRVWVTKEEIVSLVKRLKEKTRGEKNERRKKG